MAELEIHHEHGGEHDSFGQRIGVTAALIGIVLAVVTIQSHRSHTEAVILKADANDKWAYYQSKSVKRNEYGIAAELAKLSSASEPNIEKVVQRFEKEKDRYEKETEEIQNEAKHVEDEVHTQEGKALRYDIGEGLLELGLVLCSLYFISKRKLFPYVGVVSASFGAIISLTAVLVH